MGIVETQKIVVTSKSWFMWFIAVAFFAFQFVLRLYPGLVMPEIMGKFQINATSFGVLSGAYYFGYAGMQIPIGILLDRFSARWVISICALICTLGSLTFVFSDNWYITLLGRFLIGMGSAAGLLGAVKAIRYAFPEKYFTSMIGLTFTAGLSGAVYGGKPVSLLIQQFGWLRVAEILSMVSAAIAVGIFILFPKESNHPADNSTIIDLKTGQPRLANMGIIESLKIVVGNRKILLLAIAGALMVGPFESFADVWGVNYLVNVYGFTKPDASLVTSGIYMGMVIGGPILSYIAEKLDAHYWVNAISGLLMAGIFGIVIFSNATIPKSVLLAMMIFVGILCCYQAVGFAMACKLAPSQLSGLVTSFTNCINMCAGCLFHFSIGLIMDHKWTGLMENGIKVYDNTSYVTAISLIPVTLFLGFIGFIILNPSTEASAAPGSRILSKS